MSITNPEIYELLKAKILARSAMGAGGCGCMGPQTVDPDEKESVWAIEFDPTPENKPKACAAIKEFYNCSSAEALQKFKIGRCEFVISKYGMNHSYGLSHLLRRAGVTHRHISYAIMEPECPCGMRNIIAYEGYWYKGTPNFDKPMTVERIGKVGQPQVTIVEAL